MRYKYEIVWHTILLLLPLSQNKLNKIWSILILKNPKVSIFKRKTFRNPLNALNVVSTINGTIFKFENKNQTLETWQLERGSSSRRGLRFSLRKVADWKDESKLPKLLLFHGRDTGDGREYSRCTREKSIIIAGSVGDVTIIRCKGMSPHSVNIFTGVQ